jgi:hypothetical protein
MNGVGAGGIGAVSFGFNPVVIGAVVLLVALGVWLVKRKTGKKR